ncbi:MAG: mucin-desulfating sulfatase, partial [Ruthenibacterium sp.]
MEKKLLILGAGGLGRMIGEVAADTGEYATISFLDDALHDEDVVGKCVDYTSLSNTYPYALAAFGDNALRLLWTQKLEEAGYTVPTLCHPTAIVSKSAILGAGTMVLQSAIINTKAILGKACLINSAALVDHDNTLEDGVHVNLNATIK